MECPIGDPALGKAPAEIAVSVVADHLAWLKRPRAVAAEARA